MTISPLTKTRLVSFLWQTAVGTVLALAAYAGGEEFRAWLMSNYGIALPIVIAIQIFAFQITAGLRNVFVTQGGETLSAGRHQEPKILI